MATGIYKHKKGRKITWGDKISKALKGRKLSEKHKESLRKVIHKPHQGFQKGNIINLDKKHLEETKRKIGRANKGNKKIGEAHKGKKNYNWRGGITYDLKEYMRFMQARRRANKRGNGGSHSFEEWQELKKKYKYTCLACGQKEPEIKLTEDHIVPISKGGDDNISNIQPLCEYCNSSKYNHEMDYRTF